MNVNRNLNTEHGILFLDLATLDRNDLNLQPMQAGGTFASFANTTPDELAGRNADAWCVIVNKVQLGRAFFQGRPALRLVCIAATGTNNVDLQAAADHGVAVVNCRGYGTDTVAQHTIMLLLALIRSLPQYQRGVVAGEWAASHHFCLLDYPLRDLDELRLGIVGYGEVGRRVSEVARAFGMDVVVAERAENAMPRQDRVRFEEVVQTADVISLHCPLTEATRHLIDENTLRTMRPDAYLINTARGGLVDEAALLRSLQEGWIAGAAIDVLNDEPPSAANALIVANLDNLIITPHCAWGSRRARQTIVDQIVENIEAFLSGRALRRVV